MLLLGTPLNWAPFKYYCMAPFKYYIIVGGPFKFEGHLNIIVGGPFKLGDKNQTVWARGPWCNIIVGAHLNIIVGGPFELVGKNQI